MALADKIFNDVHNKTGDDKNKLKDEFDAGYLSKIADIPDKEPALAALVYQVGLMQEEFNEIRRYLTAEVGDGAKGDTGATGPKGDTGATGATGPQGPAGSNGNNGSNGSNGAAGADGKDAGLYTVASGKTTSEQVFIPSSYFVGVDYGAYGAPDGTTISNASGTLCAMWPGIDGKTVDKVYVHTNSKKAIAKSVTVAKFAITTSTTLATGASSDTLIDITDWPCAMNENLSITIRPGSTSTKILGASLILK